MPLTSTQQQAVAARGNVLVMAGAGTGKTRTLVERCLSCLIDEQPRVSLDEILVVTFTEAAAAEMRQRIRERLEQESQKDSLAWQEQLALFESAHLGTLHSFCVRLVRRHFYQLELDPQLTVLSEEEARLRAEEILHELLQRHYAGKDAKALAVQQLIQTHAHGWDKPISDLVQRLHHYVQTLPHPAGWLGEQSALFDSAEPLAWRRWLLETLCRWPCESVAVLEALCGANPLAERCAAALRKTPPDPSPDTMRSVFDELDSIRSDCPRSKISQWLDPLKEFYAEADFLGSLVPNPGEPEPLAEDWSWVRGHMTTLLGLVREFTEAFTEAKRELGVVDFHDLEQYSLSLLWDQTTNQPTPIALQWRKRIRFVFVDEYQDINPAQDLILRALSREGEQVNRFLVGDVKQSIYRFRQADPRIFRAYAEQWSAGPGRVIALVENFRSREAILQFANSLFGLLMQRRLGGIEYDANAALRFGAPAERKLLSLAADAQPCVELHLFLKASAETAPESEETTESLSDIVELRDAEKEARLVALRLRELKAHQHPVWDELGQIFRPVDWKDMAILLRAPARKAESYARAFARLEIPLQVARGGFYQSSEISDLLSLLQLLDNPLQDLPLLAVLHSPLVGLSINELAQIRLTAVKARFWVALMTWHRANGRAKVDRSQGAKVEPETRRRVRVFLERFARWRRLARQASLSRCLDTILAETQYESRLLAQPHGREYYANVQRLLALAQEFDRFQRQSLFRFLQFVEAQQASELEPEVTATATQNAVRLMSIHQSKGLEFPVVAVSDLGKLFNLADLSADVILDKQYGLCPQVKPPRSAKRYPSLAYWLARKRQRPELLGEELRLLYVAVTRARDTLLLFGSTSTANFPKQWLQDPAAGPTTRRAARTCLDWLSAWFARNAGLVSETARQGSCSLLRWFVHDHSSLLGEPPVTAGVETDPSAELDAESRRQLERQLSWQYPFQTATRQPAKTSVSALRGQASIPEEDAATLRSLIYPGAWGGFLELKTNPTPIGSKPGPQFTAAEIGTAHHQFLQYLDLARTGSVSALRDEARRLELEARLTAAEVSVLDFENVAGFWNSELGQRIRSRPELVHRELAFTTRFAPTELAAILRQVGDPALDGEFVLAQGIVDLAVISPETIWLVDFKTDQLGSKESAELTARVKEYQPQLRVYSKALERIYRRPVSESWLYFLSLKEAVLMENDNGKSQA